MTSDSLKKEAQKLVMGFDTAWALEQLQDRYRWPIYYHYGQPSVEVILEDGSKTVDFFSHEDGYLIPEIVFDYYERGYTILLSRVQKLHKDIRALAALTDNYCGGEANMNIYMGKGTGSVSFPPHTHEYAVLVKSVEGESAWTVGKDEIIVSDQDALYFDAYVPHAVTSIVKPKLTITCNLVGR